MRLSAIFLTCFLFLLSTGPLLAQNNANPPHRVQAKFNAKYPEIAEKATWKQNKEGYQASFKQNNREVVSNFGPDGKWLLSRTRLREGDLPPPTRMYISDTYPTGYELLNAYKIDSDKESRYELNLRSEGQNYRINFDKKGGFVGQEPPID